MGRYRAIKITLIALIPLIYGWVSWTSATMPFSPSEEYLALINFGIYPVLMLSFLIFVCCYKFPSSGKTGLQAKLDQCKSKTEKIKYVLAGLASLIIGFYCFTFPMRYYPALFPYLFGNEPHQIQALITEVKPLRKNQYVKIYYQALNTHKKYELHWPANKSQQINAGSIITLTVNQNWCGYYVETLSTGT